MELKDDFYIPTNEFQTEITKEFMETMPEETQEQFLDFVTNVEFIRNLISPSRKRAKDLPRDNQGRIIVDIVNPHIIEDMDYFRPAALHFKEHGCYTFLRPNPNPNSEYRKWIDEEKRRCREGYVRESDGEWVTGFMYWYMNYCPIMLTKIEEGKKKANRVEDFPETWEGIYLRFHYINQAREEGHHGIELARRGAHPYTEKVYTPDGWKLWSEIKVGSLLYGTDGQITKVVDIPYDKKAPYYRITLRDGRKITASDDHLWVIQEGHKNYTQILSTKELLSKYKKQRKISDRIPSGIEHNCFILRNKGVELPSMETKVDPYTFGLLLGDGCFRHQSCYFTQEDKDIKEESAYIPYPITKWAGKYAYRIGIPNWGTTLKEYGLYYVKSENKFIPDEYKYNSREVRLNILKGLLDSDGHIHGGVPTLSTISERLRDDVLEVARSLGYNCSYTKQKAGYKKDGIYIECNPVYNISIYAGSEIFNLTRKKKLVQYISGNAKSRRDKTAIIDIKYLGITECKCVTVDAPDSCYLIGDFVTTHNCSKSYSLASMMAHNLILGESSEARKRVTTILTAYQKEYLSDKDGTLSKFEPMINFISENTEFPRLRLRSSSQDMFWQMGYLDEYGRKKGSLNNVMGVSSKDDSGKLRGKRGHIYFEEMGSFPNLLEIFDVVRQGMEEGDYTFGFSYLVGTAAEKESNFESAKTLLYNPQGNNIYSVKNVYDKPKQGKPTFGYFFPSYLNRKGCYNKDGVSDVVKALRQILLARYKSKYNSTDPNQVLRLIAEMPITPAEAIIKVKSAFFPVAALTERLQQIDLDPKAYDDVYVGDLTLNGKEVKFSPTSDDTPIRRYGVDNSTRGALEIYEMPLKNSLGKVYENRYVIGHDPVDNDEAESSSLSSTFVLDLYTDRIVAEYTGRMPFADDNFEVVRLLCLFYNAKCLYEAHPYSQKVYTPDGLKKWEDIKIGDTLFSPTKGSVKVIDIPIDEEMDIYKIKLSDGRVVEASDNHIWLVYKSTSKTPVEVTTKQMLEDGLLNKHGQHKYFIPEHNGVEYSRKELPIDPYTMGLILSEGSIKGTHCTKNYIQISSSKEDMLFYQNNIPYEIKHIGTKGYSWHVCIPGCKSIMKKYNLYGTDSHTKFIPSEYLYSHRVQRMELLKGIMDGDGCASTNGASILITCSKGLAEDVLTLSRSLGIKCWLQTSRKGVYRVAIASKHIVFKLPRKVVEQHTYKPYTKGSKASALLNKTAIDSIVLSHKERGKCVTVDSDDGLYLIGDYIVTHNCNKKGIFAYFQKMQCTHLLADTPEYLRDKQMIKYSNFGSNAKGVNATAAINNYANGLIRDWLLKPVATVVIEDNEEKEIMVPNLYFIRGRALLEELIAFDPVRNFDRIRALGMLMLYREEKVILYGSRLNEEDSERTNKSYLGNDDYFTRNYNE